MHIIQIIASVANEAAGPSYSVSRLAQALAAHGLNVDLMSSGIASSTGEGNLRTQVFKQDFTSIPLLKKLCFSRALGDAIARSAADGAVLHGHGLWLMPNVYPGWNAAHHGRPLIVSPRGMLGKAALEISNGRKKVFWALAQRRALEVAKCLHATSVQEFEDIRAFGLKAPVAIVPNGIDVPVMDEAGCVQQRGIRTLLYLGRVHPKKGIDRLLHAWSHVEAAYPDWRLRIIGPSERGHGGALRGIAASLGLARVQFEDGLYGEAKQGAYREADVFVLPTRNENFGMVVAEALANGTPVISTKGAPWKGLVENSCGWWIDHGVEPLAAALGTAMAMPRAALDEIGVRGRAWMLRDFSWEKVAADMEQVYRWCAGEVDRPETIMID